MVVTLTVLAAAMLGVCVLGLAGRRRGRDLHCRNCNYALIGIDQTATCPECGRSLADNRAVRIGARTRRPRIAILGLLLAIVFGALAVYFGPARSPRWIAYKPAWMLLYEARNSGDASLTEAAREIMRRVVYGGINASSLAPLVDRALQLYPSSATTADIDWIAAFRPSPTALTNGQYAATQGGSVAPPSPGTLPPANPWLSILVFAYGNQLMTEQQIAALVRDAQSRMTAPTTTRVLRADRAAIQLPQLLQDEPALLILGGIDMSYVATQIRVGDAVRTFEIDPSKSIEEQYFGSVKHRMRQTSSRWNSPMTPMNDALNEMLAGAEPGEYQVVLTFRADVSQPMFSEGTIESLRGPHSVTQPVDLFDSPEDAVAMVRVSSQSSPPVVDIEPFINKTTQAEESRKLVVQSVDQDGSTTFVFDLSFFHGSQIYMAADIVLRSGDREWPGLEFGVEDAVPASVAMSGRTLYRGQLLRVLGFPRDVDRVDVVFRPNPKYALKFGHITSMWADELVAKDVPIEWQPTETDDREPPENP